MKVTVNGEVREVPPEAASVLALLEFLGMGGMRVAVEVNAAIVRRASWEATTVRDGDVVEIVQFVGGG